ncbi:HBR302Wp [Eremothecium sinecaudum]|uniref:V-type proton ATPase subunit G n=1 Tax=Eremothecium sinecaudum TaxID=45286 RepID=A0A109UX71_9SACH|nr:HBR302Wp [Eremothecium sinecaudum]AMD19203.1 HBR302Wp [Eremothecium sinecaudum]
MSQSNGIATLLKAEKEAHEIVAKARQYRQEKLKQAKLDALEEINAYKLQKEKELKDFEAANAGGVDDLERTAEKQVQSELQEDRKVARQKKDAVINLLIEAVTTPQLELHINAN